MTLSDVEALLTGMTPAECHEVLRVLRAKYGVVVHPIEEKWHTSAEAILEAIHAAPDLTQRGVRGVLAEATFKTTVIPTRLTNWRQVSFEGDLPYDALLEDALGQVRVQVKNQRRERGEPKMHKKAVRGVYVVETQRTRNGRRRGGDEEEVQSRPYRFGEFDIIAVCLEPATRDWTEFVYCPARLLIPRKQAPHLMDVLQPVYLDETHGWTRDFDAAAAESRQLPSANQ